MYSNFAGTWFNIMHVSTVIVIVITKNLT